MRAQSAAWEDAESRLLLPPSLSAYLCLFLCICFCPSSLAGHSSALCVPRIFKDPLGAVVWNAGTTNKTVPPSSSTTASADICGREKVGGRKGAAHQKTDSSFLGRRSKCIPLLIALSPKEKLLYMGSCLEKLLVEEVLSQNKLLNIKCIETKSLGCLTGLVYLQTCRILYLNPFIIYFLIYYPTLCFSG